jgi:hypothetical protein
LDFVVTSLGLIKHLGHWKKLEEAADAVLKAEELVRDTKTAYKDVKEKVQAATSSDVEADRETQQDNLALLAHRDDTKQAYQAAQAELKTAQESRDDVAEKPFDFYGSNLSTTEQTSWGKIVIGFTETSPYTDISSGRSETSHPARRGNPLWIASRCIFKPDLHIMLWRTNDFTSCAVV